MASRGRGRGRGGGSRGSGGPQGGFDMWRDAVEELGMDSKSTSSYHEPPKLYPAILLPKPCVLREETPEAYMLTFQKQLIHEMKTSAYYMPYEDDMEEEDLHNRPLLASYLNIPQQEGPNIDRTKIYAPDELLGTMRTGDRLIGLANAQNILARGGTLDGNKLKKLQQKEQRSDKANEEKEIQDDDDSIGSVEEEEDYQDDDYGVDHYDSDVGEGGDDDEGAF